MTQPPLKPWSQVDDDHDAALHADLESHAQNNAEVEAPRARTLPDIDRLKSIYAAAPVGLATAWLLLASLTGGPGVGAASALAVAALLGAAFAILILTYVARRRRLHAIRQGLRSAVDDAGSLEDANISPDLQPMLQDAEDKAKDLEKQLNDIAEERKRVMLDLSLATSQTRQLDAILRSVVEPILVVDAFGQIIFTNRPAETLFAFTADDVLRRPFDAVVAEQSLKDAFNEAREADARSGRRRSEFERNGRTWTVTLAPLIGDQPANAGAGERHGVVAVFRDITKEREAARLKSEFVSKVTHELRTPLSSIRAYVEMLVDGEATDEKTRAEYYDIIRSAADRLGRLIDNMLNISRIEAGTVRINKEPLSVAMVVKEGVDVTKPQAEEKNIELNVELVPLVHRIEADRDLLSQAVINLLSNAIKYTPPQGRVDVLMTADEEAKTIKIEVKDTGVGIPAEDIPKMFQKFFRVEANKEMAKGTGLGLHLVKHVVETVHSGRVTLASEVNKGSTFGIVLPLASS